MAAVARLVTLVDVRDDNAGARQMSVSARHEAVLVDGRRVLLLDDRGWSESPLLTVGEAWPADAPDAWVGTSVEDIERTARSVVGPDEPFGGRSQEEMEADHWSYLAGILRQAGVGVDGLELKRLRHGVVLSERLLARVGCDPGRGH